MKDLSAVRERVAASLDRIVGNFVGDAKACVVVWIPGEPEQDFILGDDPISEAADAIRRRILATQSLEAIVIGPSKPHGVYHLRHPRGGSYTWGGAVWGPGNTEATVRFPSLDDAVGFARAHGIRVVSTSRG